MFPGVNHRLLGALLPSRYLVVSQLRMLRTSGTVKRMEAGRAELFRGRHFRDEIIALCVRWDLRYPLSCRDLEE